MSHTSPVVDVVSRLGRLNALPKRCYSRAASKKKSAAIEAIIAGKLKMFISSMIEKTDIKFVSASRATCCAYTASTHRFMLALRY